MLTHALGFVAAALSVSLSWPQVHKSCVQRRTNGLSATACALGVAMPFGWITYGLLSGERLQVLTNAATGLAGLSILVALLVTRPELRTRRALRVSAGSAGAVVAAALISLAAAALPDVSGPAVASVLGMLLAGVSFLSAIPQPLALLRDRDQDISGLSPLRWRLAAGACASWMTYGLLTGQVGVWASAAVGLTSALIVVGVLHVRRERPAVTEADLVAATMRCWRDSITTRNLAMAGV
ncbi:SemiSWEET transporter [Actinoplanes sp. URMC 104]|uniref:SemiSWEET transporter n=1 Tax=Actinoplanes sp. URMC 104 TaxID=3423409 RepID=UPI003F1D1AF9